MEQELQTISESADNVAEQMADQGDAVYTADLAGSSIVVSAQDSIGQEVLRLSENMSSLTDRQKGWRIIRITLKRVSQQFKRKQIR